MKTISGYILVLLLFNACTQQKKVKTDASDTTKNVISYDSTLAADLGADEYGMKQYVMAFLKSGTVHIKDTSEQNKIQRAHLDNIFRLADEGKLILAGPFLDDTNIRGIFLFDVTSVEEAMELTNSDPAVQAGVLEMELHPWYGSAALMQVNQIHEKIAKMKI